MVTKQNYTITDNVILKADNISLKIGDKLILRDINVEIKDVVRPNKTTGQIISFLAPSGMGKSQLFKILAGLNKPTTGSVLIHNKPVECGNVGVVAQNYPLFMHKSVYDNLLIAAKNNNTDEKIIKEKIEQSLNKLKLYDKKDYYPASLSGGQRQRIAILQQILCSENFLLLDEPFSGLDVNMVREVSEMLISIAESNDLNTIIIVSHDYISASALATELWFLGRDFDAEGKPIEGARIKFVEDLMTRGFSWNYPHILYEPEFVSFMKEVRNVFNIL